MNTQCILVVEDAPRVASSLSKMLRRSNENYCVSVAHSGEKALDVLNDRPVDLLITDLCMPGISGLELIRQARAFNPQIRIILITAYGGGEIEAEAHRLSVSYCIAKPFRIEVLLNAVREVLAG